MTKRSFEWIRSYERDLIQKDRRRNDLFRHIWNMVNLKWDFDAAAKAKMPNVRTLIETAPSDAVQNASIALSNTMPRWEVPPYGSSLFDYQLSESLERCLEWDFGKMNTRGVGTLLYDKARSSIMYDTIVTRIDDLEHQFKGIPKNKYTPLQKYIRGKSRFIGQVFDPESIHLEFGMGTFTALLHCETLRAWDVYNYWKLYENNSTDEGKRVKAALAKMDEKFAGKKQNEINLMMFVMYEFINHDQILKHGHFVGNSDGGTVDVSAESSANDIIFADEENKLGFINYSVRIGGSRMEREPEYQVNPMLAPLHWGNSWETLNILRSLIMSEPIKRTLEEPREFHETRDGKAIPVNEDGIASGFTGEKINKLPTSPLDPNALEVVRTLQSEMTKVTGANVLSDVTSAKTTPFATLNAMIQVAMSRLDINRRDMGLSCADDGLIFMQWAKATQVPLMSYRKKDSRFNMDGKTWERGRGEQIYITSDDIGDDFCEILVDIKPKTPTDFQQQILAAIQLHEKLQVPLEHVLENYVGLDNIPLLQNQWEDEQFKSTELQASLTNIAMQEQMRAQQQAQQQAMAAQQPPALQPQGAPSTNNGMAEAAMGAMNGLGQGINPAMGGNSPQMAAPGMTREGVTGQTQGGEQVM